MGDDFYLPWHQCAIPELSRRATLSASAGDPEPLRNGMDRPIGDVDNGWLGALGASVTYTFEGTVPVHEIRLVFDSNLVHCPRQKHACSLRGLVLAASPARPPLDHWLLPCSRGKAKGRPECRET